MNAAVTQYLRPNGRQSLEVTELPDSYAGKYDAMSDAGCRFEAEVLTDGHVSITISSKDSDIDIELVENGPDVQAAMCRMLDRAMWDQQGEADGL